jgi:hypothetical protein
MEKKTADKSQSLNMASIFRCMMEDGYYPDFEENHIQFDLDDNTAVVTYDGDIMAVRVFFSIDEEEYGLFLEASNMMMLETYAIKPVVLDDMISLMFSCEVMCDNVRDFRRFFPRAIERLRNGLKVHKNEMKKLVLASEIAAKIPASEETGIRRKIFS